MKFVPRRVRYRVAHFHSTAPLGRIFLKLIPGVKTPGSVLLSLRDMFPNSLQMFVWHCFATTLAIVICRRCRPAITFHLSPFTFHITPSTRLKLAQGRLLTQTFPYALDLAVCNLIKPAGWLFGSLQSTELALTYGSLCSRIATAFVQERDCLIQ